MYTDIFWIIGGKKILFVFFFLFLILGETRKTANQNIYKDFQTVFIFGSQTAQLQKRRCWNANESEFELSMCLSQGYSPEETLASAFLHLEATWVQFMLQSGYTLWTRKQNAGIWMNLPV